MKRTTQSSTFQAAATALVLPLAAAIGAIGLVGRPAHAVGLTYVDARSDDEDLNGVFGPGANLSPQSAFAATATQDGLWGVRTDLGAEDPLSPSLARYIWEAGGLTGDAPPNSGVEDAPEIAQTISGLTSSANYDVYVVYWSSGANWGIRAGLESNAYTLFDRLGAGGATAGIPAASAIWTTSPTSFSAPIFTEADRTMFLGKVGTAAANAQGRLQVFLNDRPNTGDGDRTWFDGLAYVPAGTGITLTATVDRATGQLTIANTTGEPLQFNSYQITSTTSALKPGQWKSIANNYVGSGPGDLDADPWIIQAPAGPPFPEFADTLSEFELGVDGATLATGATFDLGNVWARGPFENVQVQFTRVDGRMLTLTPQFTGAPIAVGDFDGNGLDLADYLHLSSRMHTSLVDLNLPRLEAYSLGDITGDNLVDYQDFTAFRDSYIQVHGAAAAAALAAVPEPAAAALTGGAAIALVGARRRRRGGRTGANASHGPEAAALRKASNKGLAGRVCAAVAALAMLACGRAYAADVAGWGLEPDLSLANGVLTEGAPGSFAISNVTGNAVPRALLATPFDLADPGDAVRLSGTVQLANALGNQQFRFGLFNNNGNAPGSLAGGVWNGAVTTGWLGYRAEIGNAGGSDALKGRDPTNAAGNYITNTGVYDLQFFGTSENGPAATPYNFEFTLRRLSAADVSVDYVFAGGPLNRANAFVDMGGLSSGMTSVNAVGFLTNGNTGASTFSNVKVDVPKDLRLQVNPGNGQMRIINAEDVPFTINYYEIRSAAGSLNPAGWTSIDGDVPASPTTWEKAGGSNDNILSETNLLGTRTFAAAPPSSSASLGPAFDVGGQQDLQFFYSVAVGSDGDFDGDNDVDGNDFLAWQRGGSPNPLSAGDLDLWRANYGQTGGGSFLLRRGVVEYAPFATAAASGVPEPSAVWLACLAAALPVARRHARQGLKGNIGRD